MPARCVTNKSEPKAFDCPSCGAKHIIVTLQVPSGVQQSKFGYVKCEGLFPVGEGRVLLEYILINDGPDA